MYRFVDATPQNESNKAVMSIQTIFNGINLDDELTDETGSFTTVRVDGRSDTEYRINTVEVAGMDGVHEQNDASMRERYPRVTFKIKDASNEGFRDRVNRLNSLLEGNKKMLEFTDENVFYYASVSILNLPNEDSNDLIGTIDFICSDPYKYGEERTLYFPSDEVRVLNEGSMEAKPIFEMEVLTPVTFAMVQNQNDEYQMIGIPSDTETSIVDVKTTILSERGETLNDWYKPAGNNWNGEFSTTGESIVLSNWGTGAGWHGSALMREISPLDDYEIEMYIYVRSENPSDTFRISTNFYDENMNDIGMMRLWDNSGVVRNVVEMRMGAFVGDTINYLVYSKNYDLRGQNAWNGILRVKKVGNKFEYYASRINAQGQHVDSIKETFNDVNNEYSGRLKFVRFDMATHGTSGNPVEARIENIKVIRLNKVVQDETPYIAYAGDVITFDHETNELLINGEGRTDLKDFGGEYFNLLKGNNDLVVRPENAFETSVTFKNRFR